MIEIDSRRTAVYRLYDRDMTLLYVGVTVNPKTRFYGHASDKPWWPDVAVREIEWFDGRRAAERAEIAAIRTERPLCNQHPTFWPKEPSGVDPNDPEIEFAEWVRRMAHHKGFRLDQRGAVAGLAHAGEIDPGILRYFLKATVPGKRSGWRGTPYIPEPPGIPLLRALAKAFGLSLSTVLIRAGMASEEDFTRGSGTPDEQTRGALDTAS